MSESLAEDADERVIVVVVGVVGAGTMGTGIAEAAARAGCAVRLHDAFPAAVAQGLERIERSLRRSVGRGSLSEDEAKAVLARLEPAANLEALSGCDLVIEAAPEDRALKVDLFRRLDSACPPPAVLATNTSSLSVTAIGAAVADPGRVVGMHFFNPAPVMRLVEVVAGAGTREEALVAAEVLAGRMGKTPVRASDTPGFIVNRVARPFYGEALRLVGEGLAGVEAVDETMRALGFRMGPFELMDLIGVDVNLAVTRSVWEATFHEPRYRPHAIQQRLVEAGMLGRKTGRGFYGYDENGRRLDPSPGIGPANPADPQTATLPPGPQTARLVPTAVALPPGPEAARLVPTAVALPPGPEAARLVAERLSLPARAVDDGRAGIAARMLSMLINEAVFAAADRVATPEGIDAALHLGANHPRGPFEWLDTLGPELVLAVMESLWGWYREERYRPAPGLRTGRS